jgi:hypothetical protein
MRHPQALGQQQLQSAAEPPTPVAQVRALVREGVLEELLAGEILEIRVVDLALAHPVVGSPVNVRPQRPLRCRQGIMLPASRESRKRNRKVMTPKASNLAIWKRPFGIEIPDQWLRPSSRTTVYLPPT